jgi:outer membrane protein assembly factor BamB
MSSPRCQIDRRTLRRVAAICVAALAVLVPARTTIAGTRASGDWPHYRFSPTHTGFNPDETILGRGNVAGLQPAWWADTGGTPVQSAPIVEGGVVYVGGSDASLHAFDAVDGHPLWTNGDCFAYESSPSIMGGVVYVGGQNHFVCAVVARTGQTLWSTETRNAVYGAPAVTSFGVYATSSDSHVYALDLVTGRIRWKSDRLIGATNAPAVAGNRVIVGLFTGVIVALDARTGSVVWQITVEPYVETDPVIAQGFLLVGAGNTLHAFDARTGEHRWDTTIGPEGAIAYSSPAVAHGVVYVTASHARLVALDLATGLELWRANVGTFPTQPAVANGVVYVGEGQTLYAFDAVSGSPLLELVVPGAGLASDSPAVAQGMVVVGGSRLDAFALP